MSKNSEILGFNVVEKKQIVYCSEVNACKNAVATLEGAGICGGDIFLSFSFGRMIRCHIKTSTGKEPILFSELINWALKPKAGMTSFGYFKVESKF